MITVGAVSVCDFGVYVATGQSDGTVILWDIDAGEQRMIPKKCIQASSYQIKVLEMLSHGSAMFILDEYNEAAVYAIRGIKTEAVGPGTALSCASCGKAVSKGTSTFKRCNSCGLYFCDNCCSEAGTVLCIKCLEQITAESDIVDFS